MMNNVKTVIQKEEYIALAVNKYILQNATIPKKLNTVNNEYELDWEKLLTNEYLGANFNKYNPILKSDINAVFDSNNSLFIKGVVSKDSDYSTKYNYLYDFYINKIFRINTVPSENKTKESLLKGSQVLYSDLSKEIINLLNSGEKVLFSSDKCTYNSTDTSKNYFYELKNNKLTYKYCKGDYSFDVYQRTPIYLENSDDLAFVKAKIGDLAYVKKNGLWYEYYYQGDVSNPWVPSGSGSILTSIDNSITLEDRVLSYIPEAKDLLIRGDNGCMLANGDIFCWGDNSYKKAGIENYGQLDKTISPDYVNTPVMLKVQINDTTRKSKNWYNNPYRIKFEKMSLNSKNVCGISPIYDYLQNGIQQKFGGDLYCNGEITSDYYENILSGSTTSVLSRNKFFAWGKDDLSDDAPTSRDEIYIKDLAMTDDTIALLSDTGKIYTLGRNYNGTLGINSSDKFITAYEPVEVVQESGIFFEKIYALRDIDCFGAIDSNKNFWIWGERTNGTAILKPTRLNDNLRAYNSNYIFVNSNEFLLQDIDKDFYRTAEDYNTVYVNSIPRTAVSATIINENNIWKYLYVDKDLKIYGTDSLISCRTKTDTLCLNIYDKNLFEYALNKLNSESSIFNVSTYKLDSVVQEQLDNFENSSTNGWILKKFRDTTFTNIYSQTTPPTTTATETSSSDGKVRVDPTRIMGRFTIGNQSVEKTFDFGINYANRDIEVEFDFFEIDTWDMERFQVIVNGTIYAEDGFIHDNHPEFSDTNDTGIYTLNLGGSYVGDERKNDEKYHYKIKTTLDSLGRAEVKFRVRNLVPSDYGYGSWSYGQDINDESWGVDNIHIKVKEVNKHFTCTVTGISSDSQLYCWGVVGRGLPILSTSLYDMDKINNLNKLFISTQNDKKTQMSYDDFNNNGDLFLEFPTYIGGFDYPFYFK